MKVSLREIERLGYGDIVKGSIDELVKKIGAQLGEVESVESLSAMYQDVIVARVVSVTDHPNADRLHVCRVDDGNTVKYTERDEKSYVQVVCGASNVKEGMLVAWLPPGATVPETYNHAEPFRLEVRELRGIKSNGMLASVKELALGDDHEGILEITTDVKVGQAFAEVYDLDDHIIDIENKMFTHRPDCFGLLGVARELAGIQCQPFKSPGWYLDKPEFDNADGLALEIDNQATEQVPRFMAVALDSVEVKPSPEWLQAAILHLGSRPINNVVDVTNYLMLVTGQPLHAYDYDKVKTGKLGTRLANDGEKITLLNNKTIELEVSDVVITDGDRPVGLAGVMGGQDTEVDESTRRIILEIATFDMYSIRRASMRHGLFTDAVARFNKGPSTAQNDRVMTKAIGMFKELAGAVQSSAVVDKYDKQFKSGQVKVEADFINQRLGLDLLAEDMAKLLGNVEFAVQVSEGELTITAPFWRTDIAIKEDVVEEIGRLYGYDNLPLELPKRSLKPATKISMLELKQQVRQALLRAGANEVLTYSFVHGNLLEQSGQSKDNAYQVANSLSPDLQYYRLSMLPSLLTKVRPNLKEGNDEFALFEMGKAHIKGELGEDGLPREDELLTLVVAAADKLKKTGAAFYQAKRYLENLISATLNYQAVPKEMRKFDITKPYDMDRTAFVYAGDRFLGLIGEFRSEVSKSLKLPDYVAGFELDTKALESLVGQTDYRPLPKFPGTSRDLTLRVKDKVRYYDVAALVNEVAIDSPLSIDYELTSVYQGDDKTSKNLTFELKMTNLEKTITSDEANQVVNRVADLAKEKIAATTV